MADKLLFKSMWKSLEITRSYMGLCNGGGMEYYFWHNVIVMLALLHNCEIVNCMEPLKAHKAKLPIIYLTP